MKKPFSKLPKNVIPVNYDIHLKPNLVSLTFEGSECIAVEVKEATSNIILNSADLSFKSAKYEAADGTVIETTSIDLCNETEKATLNFPQPLVVGAGTLSLSFSGELKDDMRGFYHCKYTSPSGELSYAAVTQFEASDARRCFPCWDEPAIKATFDITLAVPENKVALSNMPVASDNTGNNGHRTVKFQRTPIMSTYLVAVVVGDFEYVEAKSEDGVLVRVYTPVGRKEQGLYALRVGSKVLPYYKEYFKIAYPLVKLDMVSVADFSAGAMENWGLVTFREASILVDENNSSVFTKQRIATTIGHEIAHMWFGNLVTPEWWTDLWLKEGYASFVEYLCVAHQFPEYDIWTQFVSDVHSSALKLDALKSSHPIEVVVNCPSEISEIFDIISYEKGAALIRMLHHYLGDEDFRKGMHLYLKRHAYGNAQTTDLWAALEETSSKPVTSVMASWTSQMGFPVIKVISEQIANSRKISLSQNRFLADGNEGENYLWQVPLHFTTSADPRKIALSHILENRAGEVTIENVSPEMWIKLNPNTVGFYRVHYPIEDLKQFVPAIKNKILPPLDRFGLLDDLFALVQAGQANTADLLLFLEAFIVEDNYTVWSCVDSCLHEISVILQDTDLMPQFYNYVCRLMRPVAQRIGWDPKSDDDHLTKMLRAIIIWRLAKCGDKEMMEEAKRRFKLHISGEQLLPADLRGSVFSACALSGEEEYYYALLKLYNSTELQEEKIRIARSMATINNDALRKKVYEFSLSLEVRKQNSAFVFARAAITKSGRDMTWQFIKDNWKLINDHIPATSLKSLLIKGVVENFSTVEAADDVDKFFQKNPTEGLVRAIEQSLETVRVNAAWVSRDKGSITKFLSKY